MIYGHKFAINNGGTFDKYGCYESVSQEPFLFSIAHEAELTVAKPIGLTFKFGPTTYGVTPASTVVADLVQGEIGNIQPFFSLDFGEHLHH